MISRNIVNHLGQITGSIEFPDGTPVEVIDARLAEFARPPKVPTMSEMVAAKLAQYELMAPALLREIKTSNTLSGITDAQSAQMFADFMDVLVAIKEGAFPTALYMLNHKSPSGFVTQPMLDAWIAKIKQYL